MFSRDTPSGLKISTHLLGPDLIYDKSIREAMNEASEATGEVLFSPFIFQASDMASDLTQRQLS